MRRLRALLLFGMLFGTVLGLPGRSYFTPAEPALAAQPVFGDIDCDGVLAATDAAAGMRTLAGMPANADCFDSLGDVNCSGATTVDDLVALRRYIAGLPSSQPDDCPPIGLPLDLGPSSTERIHDALASGAITTGQALLYFVQADLDAASLPAQFRGSHDGHLESSIFHEIASRWDELSANEKQALMAYLLSPDAPGSWTDDGALALRDIEWRSVSGAHVKVHWQTTRPGDEVKAAGVLEEIESYIWPELIDYMGAAHAPMSDAAYPNSGGDGKFDIYLMHNEPDKPGDEPVLGYVTPRLDAQGNSACEQTPSYMVLNSRSDLDPKFFSTTAHELMHAVQFTYNVGSCDDYRWLMESTAKWVESWLYPKENVEHGFAPGYLDALQVPLENWAYKDPHQYGSYLFWYHAEKNEGLFYAVRDVWLASGNPNSLAAVNLSVSAAGGLKEAWPESALYNWNRPPYEDFTALDQLWPGAKWNTTQVKVTDAAVSYPIPTDLGHMQQNHLHFAIEPNVKSVTVLNPFVATYEEHARVQLLVQIDGTWEPEARDVTGQERISFCRERPTEKVTELVFILSNSNYTDRSHRFEVGPAALTASPLGCKGWSGTATAEVEYFDAKFTMTVASMRFAPQTEPEDTPGDRYDHYDLVEITGATWTVSGTWPGGCIPSGTMDLAAPGEPGGAFGDITVDRENNTYYIHGGGVKAGEMFTITCPGDGGSWQLPWPVIPWMWNGGLTDTPLKNEGGTFVIDGEHSEPGFYGGTWRWRLTEVQ